MFSFAGDMVLDPFTGTGSTNLAALNSGRNSIGIDIEGQYVRLAESRLIEVCRQTRLVGAVNATVRSEGVEKLHPERGGKIDLQGAGAISKPI